MTTEPLPCDREESVEMSRLRVIVSEYEELMELCHDSEYGPLSDADQEDLDRLYAYLLIEEQNRWEEGLPASPLIIESIRDITDLDFPLIYFTLGLIPDQNHTRSYE